MLRWIIVSNVSGPKCSRTSVATWLFRRLRMYIVSTNPSISSAGFRPLLTILIVLSSFESPSSARYSHCTGISTESAAVRTLTVVYPSEGEQSTST